MSKPIVATIILHHEADDEMGVVEIKPGLEWHSLFKVLHLDEELWDQLMAAGEAYFTQRIKEIDSKLNNLSNGE